MIKYFSGWQRVIWFAAFCLTLPAAFPAVTTAEWAAGEGTPAVGGVGPAAEAAEAGILAALTRHS